MRVYFTLVRCAQLLVALRFEECDLLHLQLCWGARFTRRLVLLRSLRKCKLSRVCSHQG